MAMHPAAGQTGDHVAFDISPVGGASFDSKAIKEKIWPAIFSRLNPILGNDKEGNPITGFVQDVTDDGVPIIGILATIPTGMVKRRGATEATPRLFSEMSVAKRNNAAEAIRIQLTGALKEAIESLDSDFLLKNMRVKVVLSNNDWKKKGSKNGETHRQGIDSRYGQSAQEWLDYVGIPRVEKSIREAIDAEKGNATAKESRAGFEAGFLAPASPITGIAGNGRGGDQGRGNTPLAGASIIQGAKGPDEKIRFIAENRSQTSQHIRRPYNCADGIGSAIVKTDNVLMATDQNRKQPYSLGKTRREQAVIFRQLVKQTKVNRKDRLPAQKARS